MMGSAATLLRKFVLVQSFQPAPLGCAASKAYVGGRDR